MAAAAAGRPDRARLAGDASSSAASDGTVRALDAASGKILWQASSRAAVLHPPAYWNGRVVFGSCDGVLCTASMPPTGGCWDASNWRPKSGS